MLAMLKWQFCILRIPLVARPRIGWLALHTGRVVTIRIHVFVVRPQTGWLMLRFVCLLALTSAWHDAASSLKSRETHVVGASIFSKALV